MSMSQANVSVLGKATPSRLDFSDADIKRLSVPDEAKAADRPSHGRIEVALIDNRALLRECLARSLRMIEYDLSVHHFSSTEEFEGTVSGGKFRADVVILCLEWKKSRSKEYLELVSRFGSSYPAMPVVVMSEIDDLGEIVDIIQAGARGYIPTSVKFEVALQAMRLVKAGGVYLPAGILLWSSRVIRQMAETSRQRADTTFTPRQLAVAEALRRGKANKLIAYELNMCESTVKVHVRCIMKKLRARNRTEAAFMMNKVLSGEQPSTGVVIDDTILW